MKKKKTWKDKITYWDFAFILLSFITIVIVIVVSFTIYMVSRLAIYFDTKIDIMNSIAESSNKFEKFVDSFDEIYIEINDEETN